MFHLSDLSLKKTDAEWVVEREKLGLVVIACTSGAFQVRVLGNEGVDVQWNAIALPPAVNARKERRVAFTSLPHRKPVSLNQPGAAPEHDAAVIDDSRLHGYFGIGDERMAEVPRQARCCDNRIPAE